MVSSEVGVDDMVKRSRRFVAGVMIVVSERQAKDLYIDQLGEAESPGSAVSDMLR